MPRSSIRRCSWRRPSRPRMHRMTAPAEGARDGAFMRIALGHAVAAGEAGEVPVGAVLVCGEDIIAAGGNRPIASHDPTAHAEIQALRAAWDARAGAAGSITNVFTLPGLNHRVDVFGGVLMHECARLLQEFFVPRRE